MKPQKYAACRSTKENQTISTITNEEQRHTGNNAVQNPGIYEVDQSTQVKTYTDHGNGYGQRSGGTTHYSKVSHHQPHFSAKMGTSLFSNRDKCICSFHLVVNAPIRTWIHRELKVKIVNQRHRCNGIIPTFIYLQSRANHRVMFECIMRHVIVLMPDKGHYFAFNQNQISPNTKCTLRFTYNNNNYSPNVPKTFNSFAFV